MATVGSSARITLEGFRNALGVDENSPIGSQAELVFAAALHHAKQHGFAYDSQTESYTGQVAMATIVGALFPNLNSEERKERSTTLYKALRVSGAATCVDRGRVLSGGERATPTWRIAASQPALLANTAEAVKAGQTFRTRNGVAYEYVATETERKLTPREAGEDKEPGPVTTKTAQERGAAALAEAHARRAAAHAELVERIREEVTTSPVAMSVVDLTEIINSAHNTTVRDIVKGLVTSGKLVSRIETFEEAQVRTGGVGSPRGRKVMLYAAAPGPVPIRTELPPGVTPLKPAAEHAKDESNSRNEVRDAVLSLVKKRGHSITELNRALPQFEPAAVRAAADSLVVLSSVYRGTDKKYRHESLRGSRGPGGHRPSLESKSLVSDVTRAMREADASTAAAGAEAASAARAEHSGSDDKLDQLLSFARDLAAGGAISELAYAKVVAERDAARADVTKLQRQVAALKAAVAAFEE